MAAENDAKKRNPRIKDLSKIKGFAASIRSQAPATAERLAVNRHPEVAEACSPRSLLRTYSLPSYVNRLCSAL